MEGMGLIMLHNYNICTQILKKYQFSYRELFAKDLKLTNTKNCPGCI